MQGDSSMKFDEMHAADGSARGAYRQYDEWLGAQELSWLRRQSDEAERFFRRTGITFNVYGANDGEERLIPFDVIPRIVTASEWRKLERGIAQRVRALNAFLGDIYGPQNTLRSGLVPARSSLSLR